MTALLLDSALRVSVVTGLALVAIILLRGRSAAIRHWVLAAATVCALALPALQPLVPSWQVTVAMPAQRVHIGRVPVRRVLITRLLRRPRDDG